MKPFEKKIITGVIAASFILGGAGLLNQAQAEDTAATGATDVKAETQIKAKGERGGFGGHGKRLGFHAGNAVQETATLLGVELSVIKDALKEGKTLSQIAQEKGLSEADYLQKLTDAQNTAIAKAVTSGKLTQEQADKIKTGLAERLQKEITSTPPHGFGGKEGFGGKRGFGGWGNPDALAKAAGVTAEELKTGMEAGKSLAEIAQEKGIGEEQLITNIKEGMTDQLKQFVEMKRQLRN